MSTGNKPTVQQAAKQGNSQAIAILLNRQLQPKGITAKVSVKASCLQIMLEAATVPNQKGLVTALKKWIDTLAIDSIQGVQIYAKQTGEDIPAWNDSFEVVRQLEDPKVVDAVISPTVATETPKNDEKVEESAVPELDPTAVELAKNGDIKAISELIKNSLQQSDITVRATLNKRLLQVVIVSNQVPKEDSYVEPIHKLVKSWNSALIEKLKVIGMREIEGSSNSNIYWAKEFMIEITTNKPEYIEIKEEEDTVNKLVYVEDESLAYNREKPDKVTSETVKKTITIVTISSLVVLLLITLLPKERTVTSVSPTLTPDSSITASPTLTPDPSPIPSITTSPTPSTSPEFTVSGDYQAKSFLTKYFDAIVSGESGDGFFCDDGSVSTFFAPRDYKILKVKMFDTIGSATVRLDSSNKGGSQITSIWEFYLKRGSPKYSSLIGEVGKYNICIDLISKPIGQ